MSTSRFRLSAKINILLIGLFFLSLCVHTYRTFLSIPEAVRPDKAITTNAHQTFNFFRLSGR